MANQIKYQVGFDIDKSGLNQLKSSLQQLQKMKISDLMKINGSDSEAATTTLGRIKEQAINVETALKKAFNSKLETVNIETFNTELKKTGSSIEQVYSTFSKAGSTGQNAFRNLSTQVLNANVQLKEAHTLLDNMATTLANTVKWNIASGAINQLSQSVQQAFGYVKALDTSLNDIRIVTNKTADDMGAFAEKANEAAQSLGKSTTDYTDAALIFYQQGLDDKQAQKRAEITLKTANVTGQSADQVSEQLTAVWNGYKVNADEAELYVDRLAAVAATTASDLEELSTGMSKVASAANIMGVGQDQLAAQISTIISATREAPETVGMALKTIYARINDIKAGISEDGATLGRFSGQLADYGINILDAQGHLRDMGDVIEEIGGKWNDLTREQQVSLAQIAGGKYQYARFLSLFDNWDQYVKTLETARNAEGALQQQQDIYMESTAAHLNTLKAAKENIFDSFADTDTINTLLDGLSGAANAVAMFIDSLGGGIPILQTLGAVGVTVFSNQIAKGINTTIANLEVGKENVKQIEQKLEAAKDWQGIPQLDNLSKKVLKSKEQLYELAKVMTPEQFQGMQQLVNDTIEAGNNFTKVTKQAEELKEKIGEIAGQPLENILGDIKKQDQITEKINEQVQSYSNLKEKIKEVQQALKNDDLDQNISFKEAKNELTSYLEELQKLDESNLNGHKQDIEKLKQSLDKLPEEAGEDVKKELEQFQKFFSQLNKLADQSGKELEKNFEDFSNKIEEIGRAADQAGDKAEKFAEAQKKMQQSANIEKIAKMAGSIAQVGSSIQQVKNIGNIIEDNSLTSMERFQQITANLSVSIPIFANGIRSLSSALGISLLNPLTAVISLLGIAAGGFAAYDQSIRKHREELIESNKADIQKQNQIQSQIDSHKQLYSSLEELDQKYKDGDITRTELKSSVEELINQYGLEGKAADDLKNSYDNLSQAIEKAREKQAEDLVKSTKKEKRLAGDNLVQSMIGDAGALGASKETKQYSFNSGLSVSDEPQKIRKMLQKEGGNIFSDPTSPGELITFDVDFNNPEQIADFYEKIEKIVDKVQELREKGKITSQELAQSQYYNSMKDILKQLSGSYDEYKNSVDKAKEAQQNKAVQGVLKDSEAELKNVQDVNQYLENRIDIIDRLRSKGYSDEDAARMADSFLEQNFGQLYNKYDETSKYIQQLQDKLGGEITPQIQNLINNLNDQQLAALMQLDPEDFAGWDSFRQILTDISQKDFSNVQELTTIGDLKSKAGQDYTFYQSLQDQVSDGKLISAKEMERIAEAHEELTDFFQMAANGSYKLAGDAEQFYRLVDGFKLEGFHDAIDAIQDRLEQVKQIAASDFNYASLDQTATLTDANGMGPYSPQGVELIKEQLQYLRETNSVNQEQIQQWDDLLEHYQMGTQTVQEIADAVHSAGDQTQNLNEQTEWLKESARQLEQAMHDALFPTDADVDTSALEHLSELIQDIADKSEELDDALASNARASEDLAEAVLRFDDAVVDVVDHYDEWKAALQSGSIQEQAEAIYGLRDAYADLLDMDGSSFSNEFLTSTYNLQLMQAAIDGNVDAYNQLLILAGQDIFVNLNLEKSDFDSQFEDLLNQYYQIEGMDDLTIGARLDDEQFLEKLTNLVNSAGMTAQQATDYLASMGMDAEVVEERTEATEQNQISGYTQVARTISGPSSIQYGDGTGVNVADHQNVSTYFESTPVFTPVKTNKENVAFALKVTSAGKTSGGGFKFSQSTHGGGSAGNSRRQSQADATAKKAQAQQKRIDAENRKAQQEAERLAREQKRAEQQAARKAEQERKQREREEEKARKQAQKEAERQRKQEQKAQKEWEKENSDYRTKDQKKLIEDERDLYHDINIEISHVDRQLERVQKRQERMYGKDLIANLNKQTEILEKHKDLLKEKIQIQEYDLQLQKATLEGLGISFDAYGNIVNYMTVMAQKQDKVNQLTEEYNILVAQYNASSNKTYKDSLEDQMKLKEKQIKAAEDELKKAQSKVKDYDKTREQRQDLIDDIEDQTQKQIEINIKKFRMQLEIRLDLGQAERDWNQFTRKVINHTDIIRDSDFSKIYKDADLNYADMLSYYGVRGGKGQIQKYTEQLYETMEEINAINTLGWSEVYGDNKQQAMEDLTSDLSNLQGILIDINDYVDQIDQAYLDTIDNAQKRFDDQIKDYKFVQGLLNKDMDLLQLLYGDKNYAAMDKYYNQLNENHKNELDFLKQEAAYWKTQWDNADGEQDAKKFKQNYMNAVNSIRDEIVKSAKDLQSQFTNSINAIFDQLDKKLTNGKGLDYVELEWQLINKNADEYLDTINSAFAIQELEGKFRKALNDTNTKNLKAQRAIKNLMDEQLGALRTKEKITQYDVDRVQKLLEIEQARAALEDARASKTSMRLKRDSQGNYSYEYVADQDSIIEAQQRLATAQNELYNFDKDRYKSNLEDMLSTYKEFKQKQMQLIKLANQGNEQAQRELLLLQQAYGEYMNDKTEQNLDIRTNLTESAFQEIANIYDTDIQSYQNMADTERNILLNDLIPYWDSGIQQMSDKIAGDGGFIPTCEDAFEKITETTKNYEAQLGELARQAGVDLEEVKSGVDNVSDSFKELITDNEQLIEVTSAEIGVVEDLRDAAHALVDEYNAVYQSALKACSAVQDFTQAERQQAAAEAEQYSTGGDYSDSSPMPTPVPGDQQVNAYTDYWAWEDPNWVPDFNPQVGDVVTFDGSYYHDSWGKNPAGNKYSGVEGGVIIDSYSSSEYGGKANKTGDYDVHIMSADGVYTDLGWIKRSQLRGFASGGYTGNWVGEEGRIGILHQKEMVLNQQDTKNLLNTVNILRSMMGSLNGNIYSKLGGLKSDIYKPNGNSDSLEQNVHIDATFPNVNSKREIEQAFNDLVNLAAQRALR